MLVKDLVKTLKPSRWKLSRWEQKGIITVKSRSEERSWPAVVFAIMKPKREGLKIKMKTIQWGIDLVGDISPEDIDWIRAADKRHFSFEETN